MDSEILISFLTGGFLLTLFIIFINNIPNPQAIRKKKRIREKYKQDLKKAIKKGLVDGFGSTLGSDKNVNVNFFQRRTDEGEIEIILRASFKKNPFIKNLKVRKEYLSDKTSKAMGLKEPEIHKTDFDSKFFFDSKDNFSHLVFTKDVRKAWSELHRVTTRAYNFSLKNSSLEMKISGQKLSTASIKVISTAFAKASKSLSKNKNIIIILEKVIKHETDPYIVHKTCFNLLTHKNINQINGTVIIELLKKRSPSIQIAAASGLYHLDEQYFKNLVIENHLDPKYVSYYIEASKMKDVKLLKDIFLKYKDSSVKKACLNCFQNIKTTKVTDFLIEQYPGNSSEIQKEMLRFFIKNSSFEIIEKLSILCESLNWSDEKDVREAIKTIQSGLDTGEAGWVTLKSSDEKEGIISIVESDGSLSLKKNMSK